MYTGKIMWISQRDGNGIILADIDGYTVELYFDTSVFKEFKDAKSDDIVKFTPKVINKVNCAREMKLLKEPLQCGTCHGTNPMMCGPKCF